MRPVSVRQEANYRGYRIEGVKQGEGVLLRVTPTRPDLPVLKYSRFRTLRSTWVKAVGAVVGYIDQALIETVHECPPKARGGVSAKVRTCDPTVEPSQLEELLAVNALLRSELSQVQTRLSSAVEPTVHEVDKKVAS